MARKQTTIISLGGSLIAPSQNVDVAFLRRFKKMITDYVAAGDRRVVIICGGGKINTHYNESVKKLAHPSHRDLDWLGIMVTRVNAEFVRIMFGELAHARVIYNPTEKIRSQQPIIVGAGWEPGCSTDKDAVLIAMNFGARTVLNLSNIDYVYDKDPNKFSDARRLVDLSWAELRAIVGNAWSPRINAPFDPIAARLAQAVQLKVVILNGRKLSNVKRFLAGQSYRGTTIMSGHNGTPRP